MLGALIGDLAGSIYEFEQVKKLKPVKVKNLIEENAFFSDDTILTVAIADAILSKKSYQSKLKEYGLKYLNTLPKNVVYFPKMFSPQFEKWLKSDENAGGGSRGNGAMMRISPVGEMFNTEEDVIENAKLATIPSHNSEFAIKCATIVALIIFYSRQGKSKAEIIEKLDLKIKKPKIECFNYTCEDTIDVCLYSLFNANSFEESIKLVLSFGGDTDTNACIVGGMAESMFGIPEELKRQALSKLPEEFVDIINQVETKVLNNNFNKY